ncbi:MAG: helix-turn-helix domain-containing protein [Halioglobus sp.]
MGSIYFKSGVVLVPKSSPERHLKLSFEQFEQLAEAASAWDLSFRQLGPVQYPYRLEQVETGHLIYSRSVFSSRFHQAGGSPPGYRTFTLLAPGSPEFRWCGEMITADCLLVMPESGEFESVSPPGLDSFHVSLDKRLLEQVAQDHFDSDLAAVLGDERILCKNGGTSLRELRNLLQRLSANIAAGVSVQNRLLTPDIEMRIARLFLTTLGQGVMQPRGPRNRRMRALSTALSLLQSVEHRITVPNLATGTGVSRRTLETAFQDVFAVSPAAYIKFCRLQRLRCDLVTASAATLTIERLSQAHGFNHGGQLAADYHGLFGEFPSVTLRRN